MTRKLTDLSTLPKNLQALLDGDHTGYVPSVCYLLCLKTKLMGFFPALFADDDTRLVIATSLEGLESVWRRLPPRSSEALAKPAYVNHSLGVLYISSDIKGGKLVSPPFHCLSAQDLADLTWHTAPFVWDPNLFSDDLEPKAYAELITYEMAQLRRAAAA
jgi:hypothetical protein